MELNKKTVNELSDLILYHKSLYYQGRPVISDEKYDQIENRLKQIDPKNPVLALVGSSSFNGGPKIQHESKMLSLDKTYSLEDLKSWIGNRDVVSLFKIDGSSCSIVYKDGSLSVAKTRGDGSMGEDITAKTMFIPSIPKRALQGLDFEVRGEIYCSNSNFISLCEEMVSLGLERPNSMRNIVAGILGRKEYIHLARHLSFRAFDLIEDQEYKNENRKLEELQERGFTLPPYQYLQGSSDQKLEDFLKSAQEWMAGGSYLIDGIVFVYNDTSLHSQLGSTSHHPRFKIAYKFEGDSATTTIKDISWQVSRNGRLTPVANVIPVELSGAMIGRVTLHNYGIVKLNELKSGDQIEITRSGEVIPKFLSLITSACGNFESPTDCPSCNGALRVDGIWLMCDNSSCPDKAIESLVHLVGKLEIDDISEKRIREMISKGLLSSPKDLFTLNQSDFMKLDKVKEKMAEKMYQNIQIRKTPSLIQFLAAIGIEGLANSGIEKFMKAGFDNVEKIFSMSVEDISSIEGFATKSATIIRKSLDEKFSLAQDLQSVGVNVICENRDNTQNSLNGQSFCITGTLSRPRSQIEKEIRSNGGLIASVSKTLSYLVTNDTDSSSSKFLNAKKLGIKIITEEELYSLMKG